MSHHNFPNGDFKNLVRNLGALGFRDLSGSLIENAKKNSQWLSKSFRHLPPLNGEEVQSGIVINAGPSLHRKKTIQRIRASDYRGTIIAVDASYVACLREGLIPDYLLTLDPHPTRIVRWLGDPSLKSSNDDFFNKQDLDVAFRNNGEKENRHHIELVNRYGYQTKAIVCSSSHISVVSRMKEAGFPLFGWNPLVDDPGRPKSLTRRLYKINGLPCMNTGGNVGTAAWVFATEILKLKKIALTGMDFGYYADTPLSQTQTYDELIKHLGTRHIQRYFLKTVFPLSGEEFYIDPTYFWYREIFFDLFTRHPEPRRAAARRAAARRPSGRSGEGSLTFNCTEGGTLVHPKLENIPLEEFLLTRSEE